MEADDKITIKFVPDGDKRLIQAFEGLANAQKKFNNTSSNTTKSTSKVNSSFQTLALQVKNTVGSFKKLNVSQATINKAMKGNKVAIDKVRQSLKQYNQAQAKSRKGARLLDNSLATLRSQMLLFNFAMGTLGVKALTDFTKNSAKIDSMGRAFETLSGGTDNSTTALNKLRKATNGTMSEFDLFQQANNAMILGVSKNSDEMAEMFDIAQRLGRALGRDTASSVESLITGIGRQSRLMLDNIGIIVKAQEAYDAYADNLGTSADKLTDTQKKQAFLDATMKSAREKVKDLGEEVLTTTDSFDRFSASVTEFTDRIGSKLQEPLSFVMDIFSDYIESTREVSIAQSVFSKDINILNKFIEQTQQKILDLSITGRGFVFIDNEKVKILRQQIKNTEERIKSLSGVSGEVGESFENIEENMNGVSEGLADNVNMYDVLIGQLDRTKEIQLANAESTLKVLNVYMEEHKVTNDLLKLQKQLEGQIYKLSGAKQADLEATRILNDERKKAISILNDAKSNLSNILTTEKEKLKAQEALAIAQAELLFSGNEQEKLLLEAKEGIREHFESLQDERVQREKNRYLQQLKDSNVFYSSFISGYDQFITSLVDMDISGKTRREIVWDATKNSLVKFLGEYLKQLILNKIAQEGVSKAAEASAIASATVTGQSIASAYAAASAAASLASFGANAVPAAAGIASTHSLTKSLAKFETGGLVGGRRHSQGGTMIEAEQGEFVMSRRAVQAIGVETMNRINQGQGAGSVNISFSGNVMSQDFIEDEAIPMIKEAIRRGADIGVS